MSGQKTFNDLSPKQQRKFKYVMGEYAKGKLHHGGTGKIVKDRKTAIAIAFSEAERHG
jgi:hypothetical protein